MYKLDYTERYSKYFDNAIYIRKRAITLEIPFKIMHTTKCNTTVASTIANMKSN